MNYEYCFFSIDQLGDMLAIAKNGNLVGLYRENQKFYPEILKDWILDDNLPIFLQLQTQLIEFFQRDRQKFNLDFELIGTDFQIKVWRKLLDISYNHKASYKEIAKNISHPKAIRAVANAIAKNPILVIVPCHRIIGEDSSLKGFAAGLDLKKFLLDFEEPHQKLI